jgi:hypothetical protein
LATSDLLVDVHAVCHVSLPPAVAAGEVVVQCAKGTSPWPEPFNTKVSATAGATGCTTTEFANTIYTINKKPTPKVSALKASDVDCASGNFRDIYFSVTDLGSLYNITVTWKVTSEPAVAMSCGVDPGGLF